jgi:spore germination protein GerM
MFMNKKLTYAGISALLLLVISGCGEKPTAAPADAAGTDSNAVVSGAGGSNADNSNSSGNNNSSNNGGNNSNNSSSNTPAVTQAPAATEAPASTDKPVTPDKQSQSIAVYYTDPQQMELVTGKATIEFSEEAEKYSEAFKALQSSENSDMVPLWGDIELKSLKFTDGQVLIDIHKPVEAQLGAGGEAMAISALTQTFFQFEAVKSVELLVDGEQVESLMGHVDLEHPMTRENSGL